MKKSSSDPGSSVLVVDDNPGDIRLIQEAFAAAGFDRQVEAVMNGPKALDYLHRRDDFVEAPKPDIVLLDLDLPQMSGFAVLREIRDTPNLASLPVIMLSDSASQETVARAYRRNANAYLRKPADVDEFIELARSIGNFWLQRANLPPTPDA